MSSGDEILEVVERVAGTAKTWADLSNALFNPVDGLVAKAYPTREERAAFAQTKEYKRIKQAIASVRERTGLVEGATPTKSGRFLVRLPKSLHTALDAEAADEGVSLNQLVVAKLALQLSDIRTSRPESSIPAIIQAYAEVRNGASEDRVIADPHLDAKFLERCRAFGLTGSDFELNWELMSARKNRHMQNIPPAPRYRIPRNVVDQYDYASEMALRYIQREEQGKHDRQVSLDKIICDPILAAAFDKAAAELAPGFTPFHYRWAALGLRKAGRYKSQAKEAEVPQFENLGRVKSLRIGNIPAEQGLYLFENDTDRIFLGETCNLRGRIERHLDVAGPSVLPDWLYHTRRRPIRLAIAPLPGLPTSVLKAKEWHAMTVLHPILNFYGNVA